MHGMENFKVTRIIIIIIIIITIQISVDPNCRVFVRLIIPSLLFSSFHYWHNYRDTVTTIISH